MLDYIKEKIESLEDEKGSWKASMIKNGSSVERFFGWHSSFLDYTRVSMRALWAWGLRAGQWVKHVWIRQSEVEKMLGGTKTSLKSTTQNTLSKKSRVQKAESFGGRGS